MKVELTENRNFPSGKILDAFENIIKNVAPERYTELDGRIDSLNLFITDSGKWEINASKNWGSIFISRKSIEIIWAFCYSYWSIYQTKIANQSSNGQKLEFGVEFDKEKKLLKWAVDNIMNIQSELQSDLPSPSDSYNQGSFNHIAIELALMTIGFYIHHEIAHVLFKEEEFSELEEENKCDEHAINWLLSKCPANAYNKRIFSVSVGLSLMNVIGIHSKDFDGKTHPLSYDRLINNLEKYVDKDNDIVWGWIVAILSIHMTNMQIKQPSILFERFYDCVIEYRQIFEKHAKNE